MIIRPVIGMVSTVYKSVLGTSHHLLQGGATPQEEGLGEGVAGGGQGGHG